MSNPVLEFTLAVVAGFLFGLAYFACLWLSVRTLTERRSAWRAFAAGGIARFAAVPAALGVVLWLETDPVFILAALPGFLMARLAVTIPGRSAGAKER